MVTGNLRSVVNTLLRRCVPVWEKHSMLRHAFYSDAIIDAERILENPDRPWFIQVTNCGTFLSGRLEGLETVTKHGATNADRFQIMWDSYLERAELSKIGEAVPVRAVLEETAAFLRSHS